MYRVWHVLILDHSANYISAAEANRSKHICTALKINICPVRFRCEGTVIRIGRVISAEADRSAGNSTLVFTCQSIIDRQERIFEVRYGLKTCRWTLFKIQVLKGGHSKNTNSPYRAIPISQLII